MSLRSMVRPPPGVLRGVYVVLLVLTAGFVAVHIGLFLATPPQDPLASIYLTPDSPDWLAAGLELAGYHVTCNDRPPLLPLLYAPLYRLGLEALIPKLHELSFLLLAAATGWLAWEATRDRAAAVLAVLLSCVNGTVLFLSRFVMADVSTAAFSAAAAASLLAATSSTPFAVLFVALCLAAQSAQNVFPILAPAFLVFLIAGRHRFASRKAWVIALTGLAASPLLLFAYHLARSRSGGGAPYSFHLQYLGIGGAGLWFTATSVLTLLGPLVLAAPLALVRRDGDERVPARLMLATWVAAWLLFFAFAYRYPAKRFALFVAPPLVVLLAWVLARGLRSRPALALLTLAGSLWLGAMVPRRAFENELALAPGIALHVKKPPRLTLSTGHPEAYGCVYRFLAHPSALRAPFGGPVFDELDDLRALARERPDAVAAGDVGLLDSRRDIMYVYLVSTALRSRVSFLEATASAGSVAWVLARNPEVPASDLLERVASTRSWTLYRSILEPRPAPI